MFHFILYCEKIKSKRHTSCMLDIIIWKLIPYVEFHSKKPLFDVELDLWPHSFSRYSTRFILAYSLLHWIKHIIYISILVLNSRSLILSIPYMYYLHSCSHFKYTIYFLEHPGHSFSLRRKQSWHFSSVIFESPKDERKSGVLFVQKKIHSSKIQLRLKSCCFLTTAYSTLQLLL